MVVSKKIKKLVIKAITPFLPFIIIIVGLIFAICTVIDSLFTTDEDMEMMSKLYTDDYETQYAEWLQEKEDSPNEVIDGKGLVPTDMFTWPIPGYTKITSPFGMRIHPITGDYKLHSGVDVGAPIRNEFCCYG